MMKNALFLFAMILLQHLAIPATAQLGAEANYKDYLAAEFTYPILPEHQGGEYLLNRCGTRL